MIVRAAFKYDPRWPIGDEQRRQNCLQDQRRASCSADRELVLSGLELSRPEGNGTRADFIALNFRAANLARRPYGGKMLARQAGFLPAAAEVLDGEGTAD